MIEQPLPQMPRFWLRPDLGFNLGPRLCVAFAIAALGLLLPALALAQDSPSVPAAPTSSQDSAALTAAPASPDDLWQQDLAAWRAAREQDISSPSGWLTLVGLDWLKPGINSVGTAADNAIRVRANAPEHIGLLTLIGKTVQLLAPAGGFPADLQVDGAPAREGELDISPAKPPIIAWHGLTLAILPRGDRFALRIKDSNAPARTTFHGLNWYPPDPKLRIEALWKPFTPPRILKIPTVLGTSLDLPSPGIAEFRLGNSTLRLEPVIEVPGSQVLFFLLRDTTSQTTTYATARYLHTGLPDHGLDQPGTLILDFNRLENPPCAYTPYALSLIHI